MSLSSNDGSNSCVAGSELLSSLSGVERPSVRRLRRLKPRTVRSKASIRNGGILKQSELWSKSQVLGIRYFNLGRSQLSARLTVITISSRVLKTDIVMSHV